MKKKYIVIFFLLILFFSYIYFYGPGPFLRSRHIKLKNPKQIVFDARKLIIYYRTKPEEAKLWLSPNDLPESLRITRLKYALIFNDHISLVLARNPDWNVGIRIWTEDAETKHADEQTKYTNIYFYDYCNDLPVSPNNIK